MCPVRSGALCCHLNHYEVDPNTDADYDLHNVPILQVLQHCWPPTPQRCARLGPGAAGGGVEGQRQGMGRGRGRQHSIGHVLRAFFTKGYESAVCSLVLYMYTCTPHMYWWSHVYCTCRPHMYWWAHTYCTGLTLTLTLTLIAYTVQA